MWANVVDLLKSGWKFLLALGLLTVLWGASVPTADIYGVHIDLRGGFRYLVIALGLVLIAAAPVVAWIGPRIGQSEADLTRLLPVENVVITGDPQRTNPPPRAQYRVQGEVTPKESGVTVWLVRENLAPQSYGFSPSPYTAKTTENGHWEQSIEMWPGRFRIHAVVTTAENEKLYRFYGRARDVALDLVHEHINPDTNIIPDWQILDSLPNPCVSTSFGVDV